MASRSHRIAPFRFNRGATLFLALAVGFQTLLLGFAFPAGAARGETLVICTAQGLKTVQVDIGTDAPAGRDHDCPACLAGHCVAAQALSVPAIDQVSAGLARVAPRSPAPTPVLPCRSALRGGLASRGPPGEILSHI